MHVYDNYKSKDKYENISKYRFDKLLYRTFIHISINNIWQEYYACRMASRTPKSHLDEETTNFIKSILITYSEIKELVSINESNSNPGSFYLDITIKVIYLLRSIAYYLGDIYGYLEKSCNVLGFIYTRFTENKELFSIIEPMFTELDKLYQNYPKWNAIEFNGVNKIIYDFYKKFNIRLELNENGQVYAAYTSFGII